MDPPERVALEWPGEQTCYLTLDLECDFGTALSENTYEALEYMPQLVSLLEAHGIPLTCFVQTEVLDIAPEQVERLQASDVEVSFHPHSHTHQCREGTSIPWEIERSTERFRDYFGFESSGYRLPDGNIRPEDYRKLAENGYAFDASVFPSWRPGRFDNRSASIHPEYFTNLDLFELPFTVLSDRVRIPTALSYLRVIGRPFGVALRYWPPSTMVFNVHLHDLETPSSYDWLPAVYQLLYRRNRDGFGMLDRWISWLYERGYSFELLDDAYGDLAATYSR